MKLKIHENNPLLIGSRIPGFIFNDKKKRFEDGTLITTSAIKEVRDDKIITNSGSEYELVKVSMDEWCDLVEAWDEQG